MKIFQTFILIIVSTVTYSQEVTVKTEKTEYMIDETITVVYEILADVDSVSKITGTNFKIIELPRRSTSVSKRNEENSYRYSLKYEIKANKPGKVKIVSPMFYFGNQKKKAKNLVLNVSDKNLGD